MRTDKKWKRWLLVLLLAAVLMISGCGPSDPPESPGDEPAAEGTGEETPVETVEEDLPVFTLEELAEYDGREGRPAYVAVDGLVYDFTDLGRWSGGRHNGYDAGQDLTDALRSASPHGDRVLSRAPIVGRIE